jgi:hypothetical protein
MSGDRRRNADRAVAAVQNVSQLARDLYEASQSPANEYLCRKDILERSIFGRDKSYRGLRISRNPLIVLVAGPGYEPGTLRL